MKKLLVTSTLLVACSAMLSQAHAQKEAIGMFYELQMAPKVCKWTDAASSAKLDHTVADQEKALGVSSSEKADFMKQAEADIKSDPSNCAKDGMLRPMYDEAVK